MTRASAPIPARALHLRKHPVMYGPRIIPRPDKTRIDAACSQASLFPPSSNKARLAQIKSVAMSSAIEEFQTSCGLDIQSRVNNKIRYKRMRSNILDKFPPGPFISVRHNEYQVARALPCCRTRPARIPDPAHGRSCSRLPLASTAQWVSTSPFRWSATPGVWRASRRPGRSRPANSRPRQCAGPLPG